MKALLFFLLAPFALADSPFLEKGGLVVIEAESTSSHLRDWKKKTDVADFQGECHLEFTGNKTESGPPESPLKYSFTIKKGGKYHLAIRARKRLESKRADISNDCYVALKGDFDTGGDAPLKLLKEDTKLYGGNPDDWGWTAKLDANHKKYSPVYLLKAGETYELTIHGRSKNFNMDRILFVHESESLREVQKKNPAESKQVEAGPSEPVVRELTNKNGQVVQAKLVRKIGDQIEVIVKGRRFKIPINTLSEEDQEFLKEWNP